MTRKRTSALRMGILAHLILASIVWGGQVSAAQGERAGVGIETFDHEAEGTHISLDTVVGKFSALGRSLRIMQRLDSEPGEYALRLGAPRGERKMPTIQVQLDLSSAALDGSVLSMEMQRAARRNRFHVEAEYRGGSREGSRRDLTPDLVLNEFRRIDLVLPAGTTAIVFHLTAPPTIGVDLDNVMIRAPKPMAVSGVTSRYVTRPAGIGRGQSAAPSTLAELRIETEGVLEPRMLESVRVRASAEGVRVMVLRLLDETGISVAEAQGSSDSPWVDLAPGSRLRHGANLFRLVAELEQLPPPDGAALTGDGTGTDRFTLMGAPFDVSLEVGVAGDPSRAVETTGTPPRTAEVLPLDGSEVTGTALLAARGGPEQRPGLVGAVARKTKEGTRIQILCSAPSGRLGPAATLELDREGEWNAYSPTLIEERPAGVIHAFFMVETSGVHGIWRAQSEDGGVTWTRATRLDWSAGPSAALLAQGSPRLLGGRGVQSSLGPWGLVVEVPGEVGHRLLVSKDRGKTFTLSKSTEGPGKGGALVELGPGALLVDTYLSAKSHRYLWSTTTFAEEWTDRLSRRRPLLSCSGKAAAIIHVGLDLTGVRDWRLLFANVSKDPSGLTVRSSNDNGDNWFDSASALLDERGGADLPAIAVLDKDTVAVLYLSGAGELCVQYLEFSAVIAKITTFYDVFGPGSGLDK